MLYTFYFNKISHPQRVIHTDIRHVWNIYGSVISNSSTAKFNGSLEMETTITRSDALQFRQIYYQTRIVSLLCMIREQS